MNKQLTYIGLVIMFTSTVCGACLANEAACKNGQCIPSEYWCDKTSIDCNDTSDETKCPNSTVCPEHQKICTIGGPCVAPNFKCTTSGGDSEEPDIGMIVGIVVGAVSLLVIIGLLVYCLIIKKVQENEEMDANDKANGIPPAANNTKITRKA